MIPQGLLQMLPQLLQSGQLQQMMGGGNIPPPPQNVPVPQAPNVAPPNLQEPAPQLPQPPAIPAPSTDPQQPPDAGGFMGGQKMGVLDRLFSVISQVGMPLYQAGEERRQANEARLRQGLHIGQPPASRAAGLGLRGLPPAGIFGG